ncbi:MAG: hypothetical protein JSU97_04110 [Dehalococcoidia bacterium]|nr:MAG: hypothetical protein JSU97_04110 [Dehalococcoidia bacterium]
MNIDMSRRLFLPAAVLGGVAVFAAVFFVALAVQSAVADPDAPNPGHSWSDIGDLPGTMWHDNNDGPGSGLDADLLDGAEAAALEESAEIDADIAAHAGDAAAHHTKTTDASEIVSGTMSPDRILGTAWTSLNDGSGSGLDADLLDGLHASEIQVGRAGFSTTTVDSDGDVGEHTSVTVGTDGLPLISYYDATNDHLKAAHCDNAACTSATTGNVSYGANDLGQYNSVTVGADGLPFISYYNATNGYLSVCHCGNAACTAGNNCRVLDDGYVDVGQYTSVTVGVDGLPLISYYDVTNMNLKVAHCGNAACSAGNTITTVDSVDDVGEYTSVTVGADGLPVISYYDNTNDELKVARCSNAACTSSRKTTVDSAGNVGEYTSVTVGVDGLPVISYSDVTNFDLKVAHCSNRFCVPYHRPR